MKHPCVQRNLSTNRGLSPNHHGAAAAETWRRMKIYCTKFDQTYHTTHFEDADADYRGVFFNKMNSFLCERASKKMLISCCAARVASSKLRNSDFTTLFLGLRDKYKMYILQINLYKGRRMIWTHWYAYIMAMSLRSDAMANWEQWMLLVGMLVAAVHWHTQQKSAISWRLGIYFTLEY